MRGSPLPVVIVVAIAAACALGQLTLGAARPALDVWRASDWVEVPITEGSAEVLPFHGVMHADFTYTYRVLGVDHVGHRYAFVHPSAFVDEDTMLGFQQSLGDSAWVSPRDPDDAVVVREVPRRGYRLAGAYALVACVVLLGVSRLLVPLRHPALWVVRILLSVPVGLIAFLLLVDSFNPFALMDLATDPIHDPGCVLEHAFVDLAWGLLALAGVVALLSSPVVGPRASPRAVSGARPGPGS